MTSWGCPFACNFCSVTAMFGRKYRFRSPESVIAELADKQPQHDLLLRRQLRRRQAPPQDAAAPHDRPRPHRAVAGPDAHRRGPRRRAARPHAALRLLTAWRWASSRSTRRPSTASTSRRRVADIGAPPSAACTSTASSARHVRAGRRHRHQADGARHRRASPSSTASTPSMLNILTPPPGTRQFAEHGRRGPHLRARLAPLRRPARRVHAAAA